MLFSTILFLMTIRSTYQMVYSCDPTVVCGCSINPASITRIVGGENAGQANWAWAVSISIAGGYLCGGSIISPAWILTAAHCVHDHTPSQITIYAGSTVRFSGTQSQVVSRFIIHPNYNSDNYVNDIALLQLASPLTMSDPNVSPICIPSVGSTTLSADEWPTPGTTVVAIGWGSRSENGEAATILQQVTVNAIDYRASTCSPLIYNTNVQFCAGVSGGGKDTCQGDSGSPLMKFTSNRQWVLVGLTSFGKGCARPTYAGVYTRVAAYESWIKSNTNGAYWPVSLSHASTMQASSYYLLFFALLTFYVKFHL